ncbi:FUSC family protein [Shewanella avicenniae]|uniref:FUSC family protein n=1 Tax=Shewanella avicenniae TaxID=2814294 RepID=A0ABX7QU61_9GAMM|nr:FUSC family protein [Shewanella avicenniae]QSX34804.1 FUSC family protein [Shewanella avicenniae]
MSAFSESYLTAQPHKQAIKAWLTNQGVSWIYVAKVLLAITISYWLAMFLQLPSTRSAALTALIVMQPQTGQVLTKSVARIIGTVFGLAISLLLVALFHQHPVMFVLGTVLWCMFCIAGAVRYRDMRSYGFLLAGYTVGMIGIPAAMDPNIAVPVSIGRGLSVMLGILCGGIITALVFPDTTESAYKSLLSKRLSSFCEHSLALFKHQISPEAYQIARLRFASQAVMTEAVRQAACIEDPHMHVMRNQLIRLTHNFMALGTRLHALSRLFFAIDAQPAKYQLITHAVNRINQPLIDLLEELVADDINSPRAASYQRRMDLICMSAKLSIREQRAQLLAAPDYLALSAANQQRLFELYETNVELLFRFTDRLRIYLEEYAALSQQQTPAQQDEPAPKWSWQSSVNSLYALSCGLRAAIVIFAIYGMWYLSGWQGGTMFFQTAIIGLMLTATSPAPHKMMVGMAQGAGLGYIIGFIITFWLLPKVDGFPLMMACMAPIFVLGTWLTLTPKYAGMGMGAMINFSFVASPANPAEFDPATFVNMALSGYLGMIIAAVMSSLLFPPSGRWLSKALIHDLRMLVPLASKDNLRDLSAKIDSRCRDLLHHTYGLTMGQSVVQGRLLNWYSSVASVSHATVEIRQLLAQLNQDSTPLTIAERRWRKSLVTMKSALELLYQTPNERHYRHALRLTERVIAVTKCQLEPETQLFDESPKRQMMSYLHFIHAALLDQVGPFKAYNKAFIPELTAAPAPAIAPTVNT